MDLNYYNHGSHLLNQPLDFFLNSEDIGAHRDWESCPVTELIFNISDLYNAQTWAFSFIYPMLTFNFPCRAVMS